MSELLEIVVVRHGESKANAEARMQGRFDSPLSDRGRAQARALGAFLGRIGFRWQRALSSPLKRAFETAQIATAVAGGAAPEVEPDLAEVAAGSLEGLSASEIADQYPSYTARRLDELGDFSEYGGESYADIQDRVEVLVARLIGLSGYPDLAQPPDGVASVDEGAPKRFLLFGHGGFNFHLVKRLICIPVPRICVLRMDNCCATLIRVRRRRGMQIGEVVWHVPVELMDPGVGSLPAPAPGSATS